MTRSGTNNMSAAQVRELSSEVQKEDEFFVGMFNARDDPAPALVARVNSGHPMRGTLSIDTASELGDTGAWMQLYRQVPARAQAPPSGPRIVLLSAGSEQVLSVQDQELVELSHVMYVASDGGWFGRGPAGTAPLSRHTHACNVPQSCFTIHI